MDDRRPCPVESERTEIVRHRMARRPDFKKETVAAAGERRRQDPDDRLHQSTLKQTEGEDVGRRRRNRRAAPSFKRADDFVSTITKNSGEDPAFAFDINGRYEFVVSPNLPAGSIRNCGGDRKVHDIAGP